MQNVLPVPIRLAIYARVSTDEQREGQTIDSQIAELERFATEKQWTIAGVYKDEGWSGGLMARPELDRLRDDASRGLFQAVLVNDVDRLARDVVHLGVIKRDLERRGVQVIFRKLPGDNSPTQNLMVNILGSFAEFERELISDRTRRGRRHKVETRQQYLGCIPSYGYRYFAKDRAANREGYLQIIPEEAAVVRQMFAWVDEGHISGREVIRRLNQAGIKPRKGASCWSKSSVMRILHNEMYAGTWHYNKRYSCEPQTAVARGYKRHPKSSRHLRSRDDWIPCHLPESLRIITRDQWLRVQKRLTDNIAYSPRHEKHSYLLKSMVRCGGCGATYVGDPCHGRYFYRCAARCKRCASISESSLNETVWNEIRRAVLHPGLIIAQVQNLIRAEREHAAAHQKDDKEKAAALHQLENEEQRVIEVYRAGVLTAGELGRELEKLRGRKSALQLPATTTQYPKISHTDVQRPIEEYCEIVAKRLDQLTPGEQQRFLRTIVKNIVFDGSQVRIRASLPIAGLNGANGHDRPAAGAGPSALGDEPTPSENHLNVSLQSGRIADIQSGLHGRNPAGEVEFELISAVVLDKAKANEARRANFRKANAIRWGRLPKSA